MNPIDRKKQIVLMLLESQKPLTTNQIAQQLQVSGRTIRSDLNFLEEKILSHGLKLIKKPAIGIIISGKKIDKDALFLDITDNRTFVEAGTKEYRQSIILAQLLISTHRFYIEQFSKTLFVSRSTIEKDIFEISERLKEYNLELIREDGQGITVCGDEFSIRKAISLLATRINQHDLSMEDILSKYTSQNIESIIEKVLQWDEKYSLHLSELNIRNLSFHIVIMLLRIQQNKTLDHGIDADIKLFDPNIQRKIKDLIKDLEDIYGNSISLAEENYLLMHLVGMLLEDKEYVADELILKLQETATLIADEFIDNIEKIVSLDLPNNHMFRQSIILHLLPTVYRLKNGLNLYNPLLNEIKANYTSSFSIAKIINSSFEKYLGLSASEEEIAYIALHISVAIEKRKIPLKVAVVCPMGIGISSLMKVKLEENFPMICFENYSSKDKKNIEKCDFVLDTGDHSYKIPSLKINPLLERTDIRRIDMMIQNKYVVENKTFSRQTILIASGEAIKYEILEELSSRLKFSGCVTQNFLGGVLKREDMGSTEVGDGIVLTHGFHEDVIKTQIAFCVLDNPIFWNTQKVGFIVMLAIAAQDAKNVMQMSWLYKMLLDADVIKKMRACKNTSEIYDILIDASARYK